MMIVIPKQKSGLWKIESQLEKISPTKLTREARNEDTWSEIELHLPKFKIESAIDLSIPLWRVRVQFSRKNFEKKKTIFKMKCDF